MPDPGDIPYVNAVRRAASADEIREIPFIGELYGTANALVDFYEYGCFPHWTVWVDTLFPALGQAFLQAFLFGYEDIARGYFRPTNTRGIGRNTRVPVRGQRNKANRGPKGRRLPGIPELGDEVGKRLPGSDIFRGRKVTGLERWVWVVDGYLQRALWYWLVVDIGRNFVVNWTTAIMESTACAKPDQLRIRATYDGAQPVGLETWSAILGWDTEEDQTDGLWFPTLGRIVVPAGAQCSITLWGTGGAPGGSIHIGSQIKADTNGAIFNGLNESPWPVGEGDNPLEPVVACRVLGPATVNMEMKCYGSGFQQIRTGSLSAVIAPVDS